MNDEGEDMAPDGKHDRLVGGKSIGGVRRAQHDALDVSTVELAHNRVQLARALEADARPDLAVESPGDVGEVGEVDVLRLGFHGEEHLLLTLGASEVAAQVAVA